MSCCGRSSRASAPSSCCTMSGRAATAQFQPNHHLEVTPEFLRAMLSASALARHRHRHHGRGASAADRAELFARRFACFTFDDGYRDNRDFALPVMREFDAPFTVYVASDFAEGTGRLWWIALERAIARASSIEVTIGGVPCRLDTATPAAKQAAFDRLHDWLRGLARRARAPARDRAHCARATASTKRRSAAISACPGTN